MNHPRGGVGHGMAEHDWYTTISTGRSGAPRGPWRGWTPAFDALERWFKRMTPYTAQLQDKHAIKLVGPYCTRREALAVSADNYRNQLCRHNLGDYIPSTMME